VIIKFPIGSVKPKTMVTSIQLCHAVGLHRFHRADFKKTSEPHFQKIFKNLKGN
jgi:hypothetical protein